MCAPLLGRRHQSLDGAGHIISCQADLLSGALCATSMEGGAWRAGGKLGGTKTLSGEAAELEGSV